MNRMKKFLSTRRKRKHKNQRKERVWGFFCSFPLFPTSCSTISSTKALNVIEVGILTESLSLQCLLHKKNMQKLSLMKVLLYLVWTYASPESDSHLLLLQAPNFSNYSTSEIFQWIMTKNPHTLADKLSLGYIE